MPIPAKPFRLKCNKCYWQKNIVPTSDVRTIDEPYEYCPQCDAKLEHGKASRVTNAFLVLKKWIGIH